MIGPESPNQHFVVALGDILNWYGQLQRHVHPFLFSQLPIREMKLVTT